MIKQKIIFDKKGVWDKKMITLVLVLLVVAGILIFLFRADINSYIRNLPGYSVPEDTEIDVSELSDEEIKDLCPEIVGKINVPEEGILGIGNKQYISIDNEKTNLYWEGNKREGFIKISKGDIKVAEIKGGIVSLNSGFFDSGNFSLDSENYQKIRFSLNMDVSDFIKIHKSYYAGNNLLCRDEKEEIKIDYGFPDELVVLDTELLKLEKISRGLFWIDKGLKIDFAPYLIISENSRFEFLYIQDRENYFEIKGASFPIDWVELGRIYSDGSVWLDTERLTQDGNALISEVSEKFRGIYEPYYESNLRVNYEEIKELLK